MEKIDIPNNIVTLKYNDGTYGYIDLKEKYIRSEGGFYICIQLQNIENLKVGMKFKKGDILAIDKYNFSNNGNNSEYLDGTLAKVALATTDNTYEDSILVTKKFANKMTSYITMVSDLVLDKSTNLLEVKKVGTVVQATQDLAVFEETLDTSADLAQLLSNLSDEFKSNINKYGRTTKKSKYSGEIVDIKVHYNRDLEEYSPSLKSFINAYIKTNKERDSLFKNVRADQFIISGNNTEKNLEGRAGSTMFDGVCIQFYIKVEEKLVVGDKLSQAVALKTIITEITPDGDEPYGTYRPENTIDAVLSPCSVVGRMTVDFFLNLWLNKLLMELKFRLTDDI